ncbi:tyrosine-type recombinase/integrase [Pseudomonas japonica]|uniref:tyrosine-type recombinase/integrase n=1 Tax=Pseudomonas japonica TaxID=256466 RepID=UPI0015E2E9EA|nr:tyrosine-type recombinase/integrase [Pseudomonas japonica]MBA1245714.1 tyrosine-type recombinase/integrase [Pseudomonas japonica]
MRTVTAKPATIVAPEKIYHLLGDFELNRHFSIDRLYKRDASNISYITWPDKSPCLIGNLYILSLYQKIGRGGREGLSRRGDKGGTIGDYASKISQLLKRCYRDSIEPKDLSDGIFSDYVIEMAQERSHKNPAKEKKSGTSALATGRIWLDFLYFVGHFYGNPNFVSEEGTIRITNERFATKGRNGRLIWRNYKSHSSFTFSRRQHKRDPITNDDIERLTRANRNSTYSAFIRERRACLLDLFEATGARRDEIQNVSIDDITNALNDPEYKLALITLKTGGEIETRQVSVPHMVLRKVKTHIEKARRMTIKKHYKLGADHRKLFISERTGKALSGQTLSNEIGHLRKIAGISHQVCPHMYRHAFITKKILNLLNDHQIRNEDELRRNLIDIKTFVTEIQVETGQIHPDSVEHYIDWAFRDLASYDETIKSVRHHHVREIYLRKRKELRDALLEGMPKEEYAALDNQLDESFTQDLAVADRARSALHKPPKSL